MLCMWSGAKQVDTAIALASLSLFVYRQSKAGHIIRQKMGKKNKKNKRRRTDEDYPTENGLDDDGVVGENGIIPNGFTIDFDDFDDNATTARRKKKNTRNNGDDGDDDEDSTQQAPRGGYGSQVLPFANNLPDDHTGEPLDGHEYLFLVR